MIVFPPSRSPDLEFFDRGIKALDICNAIRDGIEQIRHWKKHLEIVFLIASDPSLPHPGRGTAPPAKKALLTSLS
ncbi:hypothetical protein HPP92_006565 [Vanilla planifolia]|uniref:Uncharacterized protein n=1 Tax=Vanilla planifolia TaxID=51239 RepID=A0A835RKM8_VANPL|nr:hypothetical protein HPP92_006824 [Vanilla planifolia]KAG0489702.1 hypothetical protein HPP92_006565 [Vanilla planifolia]